MNYTIRLLISFLVLGCIFHTPIESTSEPYLPKSYIAVADYAKGHRMFQQRFLGKHTYLYQGEKVYRYDSRDLKRRLLPGDIVFFKAGNESSTLEDAWRGEDGEEIDYAIMQAQSLSSFWGSNEVDAFNAYVHTAIYIGEGKLLESVPRTAKGVRVLSIDDPEFSLTEGDSESYRIYRIQDSQLRKQVVKVAKEVEAYCHQQPEQAVSYSTAHAALSLFPNVESSRFFFLSPSNYTFSPEEGALSPLEVDHVYCSYLVAWMLQTADFQLSGSPTPIISCYTTPAQLVYLAEKSNLFDLVGNFSV